MSRRTYGSCENCVYKEGCLPCFVFFFSSCKLLYSIPNINLISVSSVFSVSSISSVSTISPFRRRSSSATRLCPTCPSDTVCLPVRHVHLTLSVLVRHVHLTLSVSLADMSVRRCPYPCLTRPSNVVRSCPTRPSDPVRLSVRHLRLTLSVSDSHSHSRSFPVPVPVPPPPLPLVLSLVSPELTRVPWRTAATTLGCIFYSNLFVMSSESMDTGASGSTLEQRFTQLQA